MLTIEHKNNFISFLYKNSSLILNPNSILILQGSVKEIAEGLFFQFIEQYLKSPCKHYFGTENNHVFIQTEDINNMCFIGVSNYKKNKNIIDSINNECQKILKLKNFW